MDDNRLRNSPRIQRRLMGCDTTSSVTDGGVSLDLCERDALIRRSPGGPRAKTSTLTPLLACLIWRDESGHMRGSPIGEPRHPATHAVSRLNLRDAPIWSRSTTSSAKRRGRNTVTVSFLSLFTTVGKTQRRRKRKTRMQGGRSSGKQSKSPAKRNSGEKRLLRYTGMEEEEGNIMKILIYPHT
nr:hypothetical protein Iba_chr10aCG9970 [Ipomoea batatas]